MRRTALVVVLGLGAMTAPLAVAAQPSTHRIGVLGDTGWFTTRFPQAFRAGLGEFGYVEGQNLVIAQEGGDFAAKAAELDRLKVQVIYAVGPAALKAAAQTTRRIPIVAIDLESDPIESGFAASLSRPGGNITGLFLDLPELTGKWLELLKELLPRLSRIAVLWDPDTGRAQLIAVTAAARSLGLQLDTLQVHRPEEFAGVFDAARRKRAEALVQLSSPLMSFNAKRLAELALTSRLPAISLFDDFPRAGGLMSYGMGLGTDVEANQICGRYVAKILNGARPGELPIARPTRFPLVINLKTAKALGLTIPQSLLLRADEVIR